mmetsp:Transcript_120156/g.311871  ORF Transcript_120156/g.311871 Transcript_120156/m.311871 type:complete len:95 (-) Transcript_120156:1567-1851(-)
MAAERSVMSSNFAFLLRESRAGTALKQKANHDCMTMQGSQAEWIPAGFDCFDNHGCFQSLQGVQKLLPIFHIQDCTMLEQPLDLVSVPESRSSQ